MSLNVRSAGPKDLAQELERTPGIAELRTACEGTPVYLVGGAVRDLLAGRPRGELDVAVEGEVGPIAERLGGAEISHERFGTASLVAGGVRIDLAQARSETYPEPGALPEVGPAAIAADLARRDFTVNAMAIPIHEPARLIDPHGGRADLEDGLLRVLHEGSFRDDPTRVIRAVRYVARLGMVLEPQTRRLAEAADLGTVSSDRVNAELARLAVEPNPERGFALLAELGLAGLDPTGTKRVELVARLLEGGPWATLADPVKAIVAAARGEGMESVRTLTGKEVSSPSQGTDLAGRAEPEELVLARALGADWLDDWLSEWRAVRLEINGDDLIEAGIDPGPAIGRGLAAALRAKLDGEISGREAELDVALRAARQK